MIKVDLTPDAQEIIDIGIWRQNYAEEHNLNPYNQKWEDSEERHILGVRGEFAVHRALGIEPDKPRQRKGWPFDHYDGTYRGWQFEAKQTNWPRGRMLYNKNAHMIWDPDIQDVWILAVQDVHPDAWDYPDNPYWKMNVVGWIWTVQMPDRWDVCPMDPTAKCIEQPDLYAIETLLTIEPKHRVVRLLGSADKYHAIFP